MIPANPTTAIRCSWCGADPLYTAYHDHEWGVPLHDDARLFELLILEGAQAGLSWITILRKRPAYRDAFDQFDAETVARYDAAKITTLLADAGIVRNCLKIEAAITNARAYLTLRDQAGGLNPYLWRFVDNAAIQNSFRVWSDIPASTPLSTTISRDLIARGFRFVGPTIIYAYMQSIGMVNDHIVDCFRHREVSGLR